MPGAAAFLRGLYPLSHGLRRARPPGEYALSGAPAPALPLGELSPQVTERAHAVSPAAKVSSAMRNLSAITKKLPLRGSWHGVRRD